MPLFAHHTDPHNANNDNASDPSDALAVRRIAGQLFACAQQAGNSAHKRAHLIGLPQLVLEQAQAIAQRRYRPQPFTVFAVTDPKLREIFAPAFADRLVQQWLIGHIEPWWDPRFIDDSYANRRGKGTHSAIQRLQHFMRQPGHRWYCKMDIQAFFPSIDRRKLLGLWQRALPRLPHGAQTLRQLDQVAQAILEQSPTHPPPFRSGNLALLQQIPVHKSLLQNADGIGMPIGSLSSQFFANVYLNELDQYVKHTLRVRGYLRYVDDFVLLADDPQTLMRHKARIGQFLQDHLGLRLHPNKTIVQRCAQGLDFLGAVVYPHHQLSRQRTVRALRKRIAWFIYLLDPQASGAYALSDLGNWNTWLAQHPVRQSDGNASTALLVRMLSTLNSYYGLMAHADTYRLRQHIYHHELGSLQRYFLPANADYTHLKIRAHWRMRP